jgi:hypothetical protein
MANARYMNLNLERSPVGMGIRKIAQWVTYDDFTDSTTTGSLTMTPTLPEGAFVLGTKVTVKTGFTGGTNTTAVMTVGKSSGGDEFSDGTSINVYTADVVGDSAEDPLEFLAAETTVYLRITVNADYTTISAGKALVEIFYLSTVPEITESYPNTVWESITD